MASTTVSSTIAAGSKEERGAKVRAQKRKDLLSGSAPEFADSLGRFKRRTSDDRGTLSAPPGDNEDRDALVYIHRVQPADTLAGITIKYNCQATVLRKANRMWPNDSVQVRKVLVLPVYACGVKGRPVQASSDIDLLSGSFEESTISPTATTGAEAVDMTPTGRLRDESVSTSDGGPSSFAGTDAEPWTHDSWVTLPGTAGTVEIARLPRRTLGYFPPARRKSQSYSDLDTPSTSLDIKRRSVFESTGMSPVRGESTHTSHRTRRLSSASNGYFPSYLAGPGGVGTMNKNVKSPGPAQDGLNKLFASRLPNVAPPPNQQKLYQPEVPLYFDDTSGWTTPLASGAQSPAVNLENVGASIEGWVRKMAVKTNTAMQTPARREPARASVGVPGRGAGGVGDLIEMADAFEIGGDEEEDQEEEVERGRQGSTAGPSTGRPSGSDPHGGQERVRERTRGGSAYSSSKAGKKD